MTRRSSEAAISIVEVIIAALVLTVVIASLAMAVSGGTRLRGSARLQSSLTSAGKQIQDDVVADRSWMEHCPTLNVACPAIATHIQPGSLEMPDVEGAVRVTKAIATPLDSAVDGVEPNDTDGVVPDFYRIEIVIEPEAEVAARFGIDASRASRRFTTTIDRNGERQVGSLTVEVCRVVNQADERMQIQGCDKHDRSHIAMQQCPPESAPGCHTAWSWVSSLGPDNAPVPNRSPYLSLERVDASSWNIALVDTADPSHVVHPDGAVDKLVVFNNVPAGEYVMRGVPSNVGAHTQHWATKDVPSAHNGIDGSVVVDAGIRNKALVMYRPTRVGSIRLHFSRKIRTYHLGGPYYSHQTNVAPKEPTDGYQSGTAAEQCKMITDIYGEATASSVGGHVECVDTDPFGQNCQNVYVSGWVWAQVPVAEATHIMMHEIGATNSVVPIGDMSPPYMGDPVKKAVFTHSLALRYCTFYAEYFKHKYYSTTDPTPPFVETEGARKAVTYYVEPKPDMRHLNFTATGAVQRTPVCVTQKYGQCTTPSGPAFPNIVSFASGIHAGLNSDIMVPPADHDDALVNQHFSGPPQPLSSGAIWARTDGTYVTPSGTYNGAPIDIVGMGECYWTSVRFGGTVEGPCDPCKPMWTSSDYTHGCSVLTKTWWRRDAWESVEGWDYTHTTGWHQDQFYYAIEGHHGSVTYIPPWECTTVVPRTSVGGTCHPQPTGGGGDVDVPETHHHSDNSGGSGLTHQHSMGSGRL